MAGKRVLFRCNAGHTTGFGHVSRCLSVALALQGQGADVCFALGSDEAVSRVQGRNCMAVVLSELEVDTALLNLVTAWRPDVLVLDVRPPHSAECLTIVRSLVQTLAVIDDVSHQRLFADHVFLPPTPTVKRLDWVGFHGEVHMGIEWMPLGDTFTPCSPRPWDGQEPLRLLMIMGASDPWGYMPHLAPQVNSICREQGIHFGIVVGPSFTEREEQLAKYAALAGSPKIFDKPTCMTEVYDWCDAAITVFGVSAYELATCGKPALYICSSADYEEHASVFVRQGLGKIIDIQSEQSIDCGIKKLQVFFAPYFSQHFSASLNYTASLQMITTFLGNT